MKGKVYKNMKTKETIFEEDAKEYALTELGLMKDGELIIIPKGKYGEYTLEQLDNIEETVKWFYSGNWYEEEIEENDEEDYYAVMEDLIYEEYVNGRNGGY